MSTGEFFFRFRGWLPIPLAIAVLYFADFGRYPFLGLLLMFAGEGLRLVSVRYAGGATRTRSIGKVVLCTSGPYGYVRNPLYLANFLIYVGIVLFSIDQTLKTLLSLTILFLIVQYGSIISHEEKTLKEQLGEKYLQYMKLVPRIIPRLTRGIEPTQHPMTWKQGLKTEKRTLQLITMYFVILTVKLALS